MPRVIPTEDVPPIELGELVAALDESGFDPRDEESFAAMGPLLRGLAANRTFLADIAVAELKDRCAAQSRANGYTPQVLMLHPAGRNYFIRANFWPGPSDPIFRSSGPSPFFYYLPHDHNFSFLTVGYLGPGYWSDYYEYDPEGVVGYPGEKVGLRFVERARLEPGKVMLYRAHRDVHLQLPADEMSISINIMEATPEVARASQYRFDVERGEIASILNSTTTEALLAIAANQGGENARDVVETFAARHHDERIRFAALRELALSEPDIDTGLDRLARGRASPSRFVAEMCALEAARLAANRGWLERDAQPSVR
jgi:hypothetical protein